MQTDIYIKIECGERRVDVVEFLEICRAYRVDPCKVLKKVARASSIRRSKS